MDIPQTTVNIGNRVKELRKRNGLTAQEFADRVTSAGVRCDRLAVTKIETGRRQNVTVSELLAFSLVLGVAPVHLLVPPTGGSVAVTPARSFPAARVRAWIRGERPLPGGNELVFRTEVPLEELGR